LLMEQLVTSFIASACFGIIFNVPKRSIVQCGLVGSVAWLLYFVTTENGGDPVPASFAASLVAGVISIAFAKRYKTPVLVFIIGGIIPLVPGGLAYNAMRYFAENKYNLAVEEAAKVFLIAGAIAMGIVFSEVLNQIYRSVLLFLKRKG
jgi:uncharacterized membrane protein YjjB (DUF3815 family)